jgi:hypothetical protein
VGSLGPETGEVLDARELAKLERMALAAKIADLFAGATADHLAGLVWFDLKGNQDWVLSSPAALSAFRAAVKEYGQ